MPVGGRGNETSAQGSGTLILDYHPSAAAELSAAAQFYEGKCAGLGHKFLDAVDRTLAALRQSPMLGRPEASGKRKWPMRRFPYAIIYRIEGASLFVLAIAHTSRKPGYWTVRDESSDVEQ